MEAEDKFDMISGTTGLLGAADGAMILQKKNRTDKRAQLNIVGRELPDQEIIIDFRRKAVPGSLSVPTSNYGRNLKICCWNRLQP